MTGNVSWLTTKTHNDLQWFLHACMCVYVLFAFLGDPLSRAPTMRDLLKRVGQQGVRQMGEDRTII